MSITSLYIVSKSGCELCSAVATIKAPEVPVPAVEKVLIFFIQLPIAPRLSDKLTPVEEYIQSEGFQKQVIEEAEQAKARNDFRQKLKEHQEYMSKKISGR